jgi:hypothetical protein
LKKRSKKLFPVWGVPPAGVRAPKGKSFLLLFFKKEALLAFLRLSTLPPLPPDVRMAQQSIFRTRRLGHTNIFVGDGKKVADFYNQVVGPSGLGKPRRPPTSQV